jgi:arsenate reductase
MKKVLFVCIGNTCRSQMAKGFFNAFTSSESADSAGMQPGDSVNPNAIMIMKEVGIDISGSRPKKLTTAMNGKFDIIVTMGCTNRCPITPLEKTIEWNIEDPIGKSLEKYREVRDIIRNHVEDLIGEIKKDVQSEGKKRKINPRLDLHF